jgi:hypothetical protein
MKTTGKSWYLSLSLLLSVLVLSSFHQWNERVKGNGQLKEESRSADSFKEIRTSGSYKVIIQQGSGHDIKIEAEENLLPYIVTEVRGNELKIYTKKGYSINPTKTITVNVTLEQLSALSSSGSGGFYSKGVLKSDGLELSCSGSGGADLDVSTRKIEVSLSGSSNIKLRGTATEAEYRISGSADISAFDLVGDDIDISISGSGNANVTANKKLEVKVSGSGSVKYRGTPESVDQRVSGSGRVSKVS